MSNRGWKMLQLACNSSLESVPGCSGLNTNNSYDSSANHLYSKDDSNDSSDLNDSQIEIANRMENYVEDDDNNTNNLLALNDTQTDTANEMTYYKNDQSASLNLESFDEECLFGSDYSDTDPTYVPNSDENTSSSFQSKNPNVIIPESPSILPQEEEASENFIILIIENMLERVWIAVKPLKRRKIAHPLEWKRNVNKARKTEGQTYVTKGVVRAAKVPKDVQCDQCLFKCTLKFSSEEREILCRNYYRMDFKAKKNFILSCIVIQPIKTRKLQRQSNKKERSFSKKCYFQKNNEKIQVCQKFFIATLCISVDVITDAVTKVNSLGLYLEDDQRGKKEPINKTKKEDIKFVKEHIEMFPVIESHYCRKDSKKKYLGPEIKSIANMYRLYLEKCEEENKTPVSESKYRDIFNSDYNYNFFKPKKDLCGICTKYEKAESKESLEEEYQEHIKRKKVCQEAKEDDKTRANNDDTFMSITMDLQAILQMPTGGESILYYKRQLVLYNFTIYEAKLPNNAYCLCWSELNGKKGSSEIGTCLFYYLTNFLPETITEVSIFSDICGAQNRNQYISALLLWVVHKIDHVCIIEQKFLESGHTHMEVDSMHAAIEYAAKNKSLNCVTDWKNIFKSARMKKNKTIKTGTEKMQVNYKIKEFKYDDMFDLKKLSAVLMQNRNKDNMSQTVNWIKIKRIKYIKGELKIYFNYDMSDDFRYIQVFSENPTTPKTRSKRYSNPPSINFQLPENLEPLYSKQLPISLAKKKDLESMCLKQIIPDELHPWIYSLDTYVLKPTEETNDSDE